jgi:uncharacterized protein YjbJ (UPF0337 family)
MYRSEYDYVTTMTSDTHSYVITINGNSTPISTLYPALSSLSQLSFIMSTGNTNTTEPRYISSTQPINTRLTPHSTARSLVNSTRSKEQQSKQYLPFSLSTLQQLTLFMQIGNLTGATSWQKSGKEEHTTGEAEYNAAQAKGYVEGTSDRIQGYKDSVVGAITGDKTQQTQGMHPHCEYGQGY